MSIKVYAFDNYTGRISLPKKVGTYPVDVVTAGILSEIDKTIDNAQLFFVFTKLPESYDFVVRTEDEKTALQASVNFTKQRYNVKCESSSVWYLNGQVDHTVLINSDSVTMSNTDIGVLLSIFLSNIKSKEDSKAKKKEIYIVCNMRSGTELLRTPNMDEAVALCNKNPCCAVLNRAEEVVYRSKYGKVAVPYSTRTHTARYKAEHFSNNNKIFKFKQS